MTKLFVRSMASGKRRKNLAHVAWKVPTQRSRATGPSMSGRSRRLRISPAALFVNVTARIRQGATRSRATRLAIR